LQHMADLVESALNAHLEGRPTCYGLSPEHTIKGIAEVVEMMPYMGGMTYEESKMAEQISETLGVAFLAVLDKKPWDAETPPVEAVRDSIRLMRQLARQSTVDS